MDMNPVCTRQHESQYPNPFHHPGGEMHGKYYPSGWYWWDETEQLGHDSPFDTEQAAHIALMQYANWLNGNDDVMG